MMIFESLKNHALNWRDFIIEMIFPEECFSCGLEGDWLCRRCFREIKINARQVCIGCNQLNDFGRICRGCRDDFHLNGVWVASSYDDPVVKGAIRSFKYNFVRQLSENLGEILSIFLHDMVNIHRMDPLKSPQIFRHIRHCLIMPIPLHQRRERFRGFNQSEMLAGIVASNFSLRMDNKHLVRVKYNTPQARLSLLKRQDNMKDAFRWDGSSLEGMRIVLVDDVVTTGATLDEAARILKQAGAREVWGLVVAKG